MPHPYNTRLNARLQRELKERAESRRQQARIANDIEFDRLGEEISRRGESNYLGRGAIGADDLSWRQWVISSMNRGLCPYR